MPSGASSVHRGRRSPTDAGNGNDRSHFISIAAAMKELAGRPWEHSSHGKINRMKRSLLTAGILFLAGLAPGQTPSFEVASIKPSKAEPDHSGVTTEKGRISMDNVTLKHCIRSAYGVPEAQILGGPKWIGEDRWEIQAKADKPAG